MLSIGVSLSDEVTPVKVDDGAETALVKTLEETNVTAVGDPGIRAVKESNKNHSLVSTDLAIFSPFKRVCMICYKRCLPLGLCC